MDAQAERTAVGTGGAENYENTRVRVGGRLGTAAEGRGW